MKKIFLLLTLLAVAAFLFSETVVFDHNFSKPVITTYNGYQKVNFENSVLLGKIGEPSLPYLGIKLLLPKGESAVKINIVKNDLTPIDGEFTLLPGQPSYKLSDSSPPAFAEPNPQIYSKNENFPQNAVYNFTTQYLAGFSICFVAVTPLKYNPVKKKIAYYQNIKIEVQTAPNSEAQEALRFLHNSQPIVNFVTENVSNPEMLANYNLQNERDDEIDYLIIAAQNKVALWQNLADIYIQRGYTTEITTIEDIQFSQTGIDLQDKIRNFLIDKFTNNSIRFVLLAGDDNIIPHRGLYANVGNGQEIDNNIPSDIYFCALDGNWNADGDDKWGEPTEADLAPEFALGRFCYNNDTEINNFINKVSYYLNNPIENELLSSLFVGEYLWEGPTWGGDYMDEMIGGSSTNGHETVGVPTSWNISTLYERDGNWTDVDILNAISNGPNLINHLGHSNDDYNMKLYSYQVTDENITNNGENHGFPIIFTQGCYAGAFDSEDCITEKFTSISHGAVSMISHSRYGWGQQGSTNGASQFFHREFIDALFGENIFDLGYALNDAKIDAIPFMSYENTVYYWVDYETNIIGDPALSVWTEVPQNIELTYPQQIQIGTSEIEVSSSLLNLDVAVLNENNEIIGRGNTNIIGSTIITFDTPVQETGNLTIVSAKANHYTFSGNIAVVPTSGPFVICQNAEFEEFGNYLDGSIQSLDSVNVSVTLENIGLENTEDNLTAVLSSDYEFVTVLNNTAEISPLETASSTTLENAFQIKLLAGIVEQTSIPFTLTVNCGSSSWQSGFSLTANAPCIEYNSYTMNVTSGDDQVLEPGESAELYLTYHNSGIGYSYELSTTLFSYDPYVTVNGSDVIDSVNPNQDAVTSSPFILEISPSCPPNYSVQLELLVYDILGSNIMSSFQIPVGTVIEDFENGMGNWTHSALSAGYVDEWHLETSRNHTQGGTYSIKCGGTGNSDYSNNVHSGLTTPPFVLPTAGYVTFYHWMAAETNSSTQAWDGGLIEISVNNGEFQQVEPVGGYHYTIMSNDESPFAPGTAVFSGNINWQPVEINLSSFSGTVRLRFVFGSDGYVTDEGWYIDDFAVHSYSASENNSLSEISKPLLRQNYPNPFNPTISSGRNNTNVTKIAFQIPQKTAVDLSIYNIKGQRVRTLVNEEKADGEYLVSWDGKDSFNRDIASGIYFYKLKAGKFTSVKKLILMK